MTTTAAPPPPQWPDEVLQLYEPVRKLGKGGFASVMLARQKANPSSNANSKEEVLVAIKVVGSKDASEQEHGYAHREIDILQELQHPNIMKVYDFWEPSVEESKCAAVMALSYSKGPTLEHLLQHGGAVSLIFGRVVTAQLVDALAYCHGRAVIHRDIKPDNLVVTGASIKQDEIWDDTATTSTATGVRETQQQQSSQEDWKSLRQKWHVTLIDFGFARALGPDDLEREKVTMKQQQQQQASQNTPISHKTSSMDNSTGSEVGSSRHSGVGNSSRHSVSYRLTRKMSALGNRMYAAPEIINGVQDRSIHGSIHIGSSASSRHSIDITKTLSAHVSNYGMLADAFSLGNTLKYLMTGVPPNQNVSEVIRNQNNPLLVLGRWMALHLCSSSATAKHANQARQYQYRGWKDLPEELVRMIRGMTHPGVSQRTSVRAARRYPYIDDALSSGQDSTTQESLEASMLGGRGTIDFLQCTMKQKNKNQQQQQQKAETTDAVGPATVEEGDGMDDQIGLEL